MRDNNLSVLHRSETPETAQRTRNLYLRPSPAPATLCYLPDWFADRVEIEAEGYSVPLGTWLRVTDQLIRRLEIKRNKAELKDPEAAERITTLLDAIEREISR